MELVILLATGWTVEGLRFDSMVGQDIRFSLSLEKPCILPSECRVCTDCTVSVVSTSV
jgi:hypothetical protein